MSKRLSGFPELLPSERFVEREVVASLARTFELHGFANVETRAVEPLDQLLQKGETSKEVYVLKRLQDTTDGNAGMGLHFDLTVPFARYVLENAGKLEFPFRRYQIQKVWRGERPQEGRFREFLQADIDVIGRGELSFHHDVEVARVMVEALSALNFLPGFRLQVNNRKVLEGFCLGLDIELGIPDVLRAIDRLDKASPDFVMKELVADAGLSVDQANACLNLAAIHGTDSSVVDRVRALNVEHPLLEEGLEELEAVLLGCSEFNTERVQVVADLRIARGLDYYTGTVFETRLSGFESLGSICSGGRYDALARDAKTKYPGVGISFGVSRVLIPLLSQGVVTADRSVPSAVLVAVSDELSRSTSDALAQSLRANGIPAEVAPSADKFGKQIRYADRRGIPFVLFPNFGNPEIRDIRTGTQIAIDPTTWVPAAKDLKPRITTDQEKTQ